MSLKSNASYPAGEIQCQVLPASMLRPILPPLPETHICSSPQHAIPRKLAPLSVVSISTFCACRPVKQAANINKELIVFLIYLM
ncbi:hypothetical protein FM107_00105 [Sphingobacterium sp. JB170]|nr:hypothetical protein FM107_00105 [Sphingobacterium sp. JB170]